MYCTLYGALSLKVRKWLLTSVLPLLRKLRDHGKTRKCQRQCGAPGKEKVDDSSEWITAVASAVKSWAERYRLELKGRS